MTAPATGPAPTRNDAAPPSGAAGLVGSDLGGVAAGNIVDRREENRRANWTTAYLERRARLRTAVIAIDDPDLAAEQIADAVRSRGKALAFIDDMAAR
jgi:alkanesulfonate monooxygenase SsuD/methylene tetrahydromethanopterin reductase-like flavin-dependent oxidoreductase (luciferase family)